MDRYGTGRPPGQAPPAPTLPPNQQLSSRINFSDATDYDTYDPYQAAAQDASPSSRQPAMSSQPAAARAGQPTLKYEQGPGPNSSGPGWSLPYTGYTGAGNGAGAGAAAGTDAGYQPVAVTGGPVARPQRTRTFSRTALLRKLKHPTIVEEPDTMDSRESIGLTSLVGHAAPMGSSKAYSPVAKDDPDQGVTVPFDLSGFMGPTTGQDDAFIKKLQEQEASGKLTGGLGVGFGAGTTIRESELLATSPVAERGSSLRRTFSRRPGGIGAIGSIGAPGRQGTVKALAQSEANKRGEIVEVIIEEPEEGMASEVDLSLMVGPAAVGGGPGADASGMRRSTLPTKDRRTEVFYPQPDWKPFSMRWPYLLALILLSIGLGGAQEVIFQLASRNDGLLHFTTPSQIPGAQYFAIKFAPTLITVTYGVLWQITDFEVKRLEAFYQLSKERGALAAESINVDYVTHFSFLRPFRALYCRHYAVAISSVASLLAVSLVPTSAAASIVLTPGRAERMAHPEGLKTITISPVWSRVLSAAFLVIALLGCALFWLLQTRRSGLLSDVKGIAGLASMAVVSHILTDFKDMDVATHEDIHHRLRDHRYVLRNSCLAPDDDDNNGDANHPASTREKERSYRGTAAHLSQNPHPLMLRAAGCLPFIAGIVLFAVLIPTFLFTEANVLTDRAPWVATALAVWLKLAWGSLETSVRMMEPYYILSRRHAPPKTLTLDYTAMPFAWVALQALLNRHFLVFFVGFGTVMTELLTVLVTSLATVEGRDFLSAIAGDDDSASASASASPPSSSSPSNGSSSSHEINSGQETEASFWATLGLATFILGYMALVASAVLLRRRRAFLPRQPNTIASVLAFIHQSKMLYDFVGTSKLGGAAMLRRLEALDGGRRGRRTYGLGWFEGRDGQTHCGVDQEELLSDYRPGYDYSRSNKPWNDEPVDWL